LAEPEPECILDLVRDFDPDPTLNGMIKVKKGKIKKGTTTFWATMLYNSMDGMG
jgi:hypothetical protein